jgi:hypothetical protein
MRRHEINDDPKKVRLELEDREDAEYADRALHDVSIRDKVKGFKSHLAESVEFPLLLGFTASKNVLAGLDMRLLTIEEINDRKQAAGHQLGRAAVLHEAAVSPDEMAQEAIPDDAMVAVIDIKSRRQPESPSPDLTAA